MKTVMLAKTFLKGHYREGEPTGFRAAFVYGKKIHTIRANAKKYYKSGEWVSVRQWKDKPYRSKHVTIGHKKIGIEPVTMVCDNGTLTKCVVRSTDVNEWDIALNDGLVLSDFIDWFFPSGCGEFSGDILHFTDFRYSATSNEEQS